MAARPKQRPEALAQFAETARTDQRKDRPGLIADESTAPIPTSAKEKDEAATKVLQEGATGQDSGAEAAIDKLPDRIFDSRRAAAGTQDEEPEWPDRGNYNAATDPRTGRPPLPIEADALNKERELQQLRNAQLTEGEDDILAGEEDIMAEEEEIDVILEDSEMVVSGVIEEQEPTRMISPDESDDGDADAEDSGKPA
jgi:hypothetical protein